MIIYCYELVLQKEFILLSSELVTVMGHILVFSTVIPYGNKLLCLLLQEQGYPFLPVCTPVFYNNLALGKWNSES